MKKLIIFFLSFLFCLNITAQEYTLLPFKDLIVTDNGYIYGYYSDEVGIPEYVLIPDSIGDKKIRGIYSLTPSAMVGMNPIKGIKLPDGLLYIGDYAFNNEAIGSITIPESVVYIGDKAFKDNPCFEKGTIVLPKPIKPDHTFQGWINQDTLLSDNSILSNYFNYKASFSYDKNTPYCLSNLDVNIHENIIKDCCYYGHKEIIIPKEIDNQTIRSIGGRAFVQHELTQIRLPKSIKTVEDGAFNYNELSEVMIPECVKYIGKDAFAHNKLNKVVIPQSVQYIGEFAFSSNEITSFEWPESLDIIKKGTFSSNKISELQIPKSVNIIGEAAFMHNQIQQLKLHNNIVYIGFKAFANNNLIGEKIPVLPSSNFNNKTLLYWQSFKRGRYIPKIKSREELSVAKCQPGDKMDLNLGYKAVFKEDL